MGAPSSGLPQSEVLTSNPPRASQLDGVSQHTHGALDTRYPTVPLLQPLLVLEVHCLATGFAKIRQIAVVPDTWSPDNGLMTPTLKLRRSRILEKYQEQTEKLYAGH